MAYLDEEAQGILPAWTKDPILRFERLPGGVVNDTWLVETATWQAALRRHRREYRTQVELEHAVADFASGHGIPCPKPRRTLGNARYHEHCGRFWTLYEWAPGRPLRRGRIDAPTARVMGEWLARLHLVLRDFPLEPSGQLHDDAIQWGSQIGEYETEATLAQIERLLAAVRKVQYPNEQDRWAIEELESRAEWLAAHRDFDPPRPDQKRQMLHADYRDANLFFDSGRLASIIDWDEVIVGWPCIEVIRTVTISLSLQPALVVAFLAGYREITSLPFELLGQGIARYTYEQAHALWIYRMVYVEGDHRLRGLLRPGRFVPFQERWANMVTWLDG